MTKIVLDKNIKVGMNCQTGYWVRKDQNENKCGYKMTNMVRSEPGYEMSLVRNNWKPLWRSLFEMNTCYLKTDRPISMYRSTLYHRSVR